MTNRRLTRQACLHILGPAVYNALAGSNFPLPSIMDSAAKVAFRMNLTGEEVETLREALQILHRGEYLE